jgi:hypothetical protein
LSVPTLRKEPSFSPPELPRILRKESSAPPKENPRTLGFPATLVEFFAPSTRKPERVYLTPVYLTGYVPPTGFLTLTTVCSSLERLALFHARNVHGVLLSRGFPSQPGPVAHHYRMTLLAFLHHIPGRLTLGMRGVWYLQASRPAVQTIGRLQGVAPVANPYRGRTFTSETQRPIPS